MNIRLVVEYAQKLNAECPICLELIKDSAYETTSCDHMFHSACLDQLATPVCPLCRASLIDPEHSSGNATQRLNELNERFQSLSSWWFSNHTELTRAQFVEVSELSIQHDAAREALHGRLYALRLQATNEASLREFIEIDASLVSELDQMQSMERFVMQARHRNESMELSTQYWEMSDDYGRQMAMASMEIASEQLGEASVAYM